MNGQDRSKSRFMSAQKPLKQRQRRAKDKATRKNIDLMELHRTFVETDRRRRASKPTWIKVVVFLVTIPGFFLLGYWIATLSVSTPMKALIALPVAVLGIILSYVVSSLLR